MRVKPLTRGMVDQTPPLWRPTGAKKPTAVGLDDGVIERMSRYHQLINFLEAPKISICNVVKESACGDDSN